MREPWQLLTIPIVVGRNAHARVTIAMIAILMHDGPACAGRGQISVTSKYGLSRLMRCPYFATQMG